jgi:AraC-like DNA-binding protein
MQQSPDILTLAPGRSQIEEQFDLMEQRRLEPSCDMQYVAAACPRSQQPFSCKFLANEFDREKINKARAILLERIGDPITIKELSRKVAINECYLKKGFKEMFGTTIFDFYQSKRMEYARYLLYEKGLSVTDVSMMLGYSSISHFSTAFKKHTGLKPCELLLR